MNKNIRILFIDDEEMLVELAESYFEDMDNYDIVVANNKDDAYKYFVDNNSHIDVVICDQCLAGDSGLELVEKFYKIQSNIYYYVVTGSLSLGENAKKYKEIIAGVIHKPFSFNELCSMLESLEFGGMNG